MTALWLPFGLALLAACAASPAATSIPASSAAAVTADPAPAHTDLPAEEETVMQLSINGQPVTVTWAQNEAAAALAALVEEGALTVTAEPYGGFEVVGSLGCTLPAEDEQTTTQAGDIMLYNSDSVVVFHGSNTWAYTRLGRIEGLDAAALRELFGSGSVELTLSR